MLSPITGKEMRLIKEPRIVPFRKEEFEILHHAYLCEDSGEQFTTTALDELNITQVYNQYRSRHKLPFPEEITGLREKYGLSAAKMAEILGFGANIYRNYEKGEVPSESNARLIQMAMDPHNFKLLLSQSEAVKGEALKRLLHKIENEIEKDEKNIAADSLTQYLIGPPLPNEFTGYRKPDLHKLLEMVVFFAQKLQPYKTKLNKLLFYADFYHFKRTGFSISGARYAAINMGPVAENFNSVFDHAARKQLIDILEVDFDGNIGEQFVPANGKEWDAAIFSENEKESLEIVAKRFFSTSTRSIIDISHREEAWKANVDNKTNISYLKYGFTISEL